MANTVRIGKTWMETWEEDDPMGDASFEVFRHPNGETVTLAYLDHDDGVSGCESEKEVGWFVVDEEDGSWSHLGSDEKDRDTFLLQWVASFAKKGKEARWAVYHSGYENGLRGTYGVESDGEPRQVSVHRTKKEAKEACRKLQEEARVEAHFRWYECGNPGVLMPLYSVKKK